MSLQYNTQKEKLILPEYGRNIQQMVDYCVTIPDREERTRCAYTIIQIMGNLFPQIRDSDDYKHKLWDHLAIMSDFKLDIDFPYEVVKKENLESKPQKVEYKLDHIKYRHYGKLIEMMIDEACKYPEGDEKNALVSLIANHMKKLIFSINKDGVEDEKILKDLYHYSKGKINLDPATYKLREFKEAPAPAREAANAKPLETLYKDDFAWIVNKPAGLLTQPDERGGDSLITRALAELGWSRSDYRPATVQRLDRNTSGAVIIALTGRAQRTLAELVRERKIRKIYRAVVEGEAPEKGKIDLPLLKDARTNTVRPDEGGQRALTLYRRIALCGSRSVVEAELVTGRPHQARAHLAAIGHPIAGDAKYGGKMGKRPLLHARLVIFPDDAALPAALRGARIEAPLPDDMKKYERGELQ